MAESEISRGVADAIQQFITAVPTTRERPAATPADAALPARQIAQRAALRAAALSGALALPPGPVGVLTILPDLVGVWRIQAQMVADIAGTYGKSAALKHEEMLYCLFRHAAAQAVRDVVVRVGERFVVRRGSLRIIQGVVQRVGVNVTQRVIAKSAARWLPVIGALGVGGYAYYDTGQVADTAIAFFSTDNVVEGGSTA